MAYINAEDVKAIRQELKATFPKFKFGEADVEDIVGMLHMHSNYSDGVDSIIDLSKAVKKRGFSYMGITDHSQTATYARGLSFDRVKRQWEEIDKLDDDEKNIVYLFYVNGLKQLEISEKLNFSRSKVSRLHALALEKLKKRLKRKYNEK